MSLWTGPNDAPLSTKEERMAKLRQHMGCACMRWARVPEEHAPKLAPISNHHPRCPEYQLLQFMVLELDGTRCVMTMLEGEAALHAEPDHSYTVSTVQMTADQFDSLEDFAGF